MGGRRRELNDYLMWQVARSRAVELRAEACGARLANALRSSRLGSGRHSFRIGGLWTGLVKKLDGREVEEVCCA
jgi:hypothetical protein